MRNKSEAEIESAKWPKMLCDWEHCNEWHCKVCRLLVHKYEHGNPACYKRVAASIHNLQREGQDRDAQDEFKRLRAIGHLAAVKAELNALSPSWI